MKQRRKPFVLPSLAFAVLVLAALACNAPGVSDSNEDLTPTVDITPTPVVAAEDDGEEEEETPEPTEEPEEEEEPQDEPTPVPEDSDTSDGELNMAFVQDVNVPDGTRFDAGTQFDKTWRVRNSGTLPWPQGTQLVYVRGNQLGGPASITVPPTAVNNVIDMTVSMTAPSQNGEYQSYWRLRSPGGQFFGPEVFAVIEVGGGSDGGDDNDDGDSDGSSDGDDGGGEQADGPDLVIRLFGATEEAEAGIEFELEVIVKNEGNQDAAASVLDLDIEGGDDSTYEVPALAAGEEARITPDVTLDDDATYRLTAAADINNDVSESNEGNNAAIIEIEVGAGIEILVDGSMDIEANDCADLDDGDEGSCGGSGDDLRWVVDTNDTDERELQRENDAEMAVFGTSRPSYSDCKASGLSSDDIDADVDDTDIPDGTYVCFETDEGNYGYILITDFDDTLEVDYLVWDEDSVDD